jgi:hypothetical protein
MKNTNETFTEEMTTDSAVKEMIRDVQNEFDDAELHADTKKLQKLLAEDFQGIGPKGFVLNKEQWINRHKQFKYEKLDTSEMNIRLYRDTAIVSNIQKNKATFNNEPVNLTVRVSQVWLNENGQWKLASIQFSPMAES